MGLHSRVAASPKSHHRSLAPLSTIIPLASQADANKRNKLMLKRRVGMLP